MNPRSFEYFAPPSLNEAIDILDQHRDEAKIIAGGQSLMPLLKMRLASFQYLVDLRNVPDLSYINDDELEIGIGSMTTHRTIEFSPIVAANCPVLAEAAGIIGDPLIRNRGTIGGSVCHADPSADYPAVILSLDGKLVVRGKDGKRTIESRDFFVDIFTTSLKTHEVLTEVRLPKLAADSTAAYEKLTRRQGDFALVGAATFIRMRRQNCEEVRVALSGVAPTPVRAEAAEHMLKGKALTDTSILNASKHAAQGLRPPSNVHASREYRLAMVEVATRRALERCKHNLRSRE